MSNTIRKVLTRFAKWYLQGIRIRELNTLSDAALKDIGLHRSGIRAAVGDLVDDRGRPRTRAA